MKRNFVRAAVLICLLAASSTYIPQPAARAQAPPIHVQSSLVLVDVITQDPKSGLPVRDFKKEDFRVFDNRQEVQIATFDSSERYDTRPIILWLVVICNEGGIPGGSAQFAGKEALLRPPLDHLARQDTVGVAHWCDNGETQLDLLPTADRDRAIQTLAETIKPIPFQGGTSETDAVGEVTSRKMVRLIIQDAHRRDAQPLPAIVFSPWRPHRSAARRTGSTG